MNSTFFDKKASGEIVKNENISNKELTREYTSQFFKKFEKGKVKRHFIDNIWGADLAVTSISNLNK